MTPRSLTSLSLRSAGLLLAGLALPLTACSTTPPASASAPSAVPAAGAASTPAVTPTPTPSATTASATPTPTPSPSKSSAAASGYTMAQVRKHANAASCWTVIGGNVYDLTKWVNRHPGGRARILGLCGKDGTAAFRAEHGTKGRANQVLAGYELGPLA